MAFHGKNQHPARKEVKGPAGGRIASSLSCEDSFLDQSLPAIAGCAAGSVTVSSDMGRWIFFMACTGKKRDDHVGRKISFEDQIFRDSETRTRFMFWMFVPLTDSKWRKQKINPNNRQTMEGCARGGTDRLR